MTFSRRCCQYQRNDPLTLFAVVSVTEGLLWYPSYIPLTFPYYFPLLQFKISYSWLKCHLAWWNVLDGKYRVVYIYIASTQIVKHSHEKNSIFELNQNRSNPELLCTLNLNLFYCFLIMFPYLFRCLTKNSNAEVVIHTYKPVCVELYKDYKDLGRFMLRYSGETIAVGRLKPWNLLYFNTFNPFWW